MEEHWRAGFEDANTTLAHPEVLELPKEAQSVAVYDFLTPAAERGRAKS
jgi:NTE family protein